MAIQDELEAMLAEMLPEGSREEVLGKAKGMFEKISQVVTEKNADLEKYKTRARELEAQVKVGGAGAAGADPEAYRQVLAELAEKERLIEAKQKELDELSGKFQGTARNAKELSKLAELQKEKLEKESRMLDATVKSAALREAVAQLSFKDPAMSNEVFALLSPELQIATDENGIRKVFARIKGEGGVEVEVTPADFVRNFAETSPLAKAILAAPRNSGGGAMGSGGAGSIGGPKTTEMAYQEALSRGDTLRAIQLKAKLASEMKG